VGPAKAGAVARIIPAPTIAATFNRVIRRSPYRKNARIMRHRFGSERNTSEKGSENTYKPVIEWER
jgi:hypothetical protein